MSLMDGKVTLDGESFDNRRGNNGNNNGRKNNNRQNGNNGGFFQNNQNNNGNNNQNDRKRGYSNDDYQFMRSSYLTDEIRESMNNEDKSDKTEQVLQERDDRRAGVINAFCDDFTDSSQDFKRMRDVVIDEFPDAIKHIKGYYNQKNGPMYIDAANRLIKTICTSQFANALDSTLESGVWSEDGTYDRIWRNIAFALSIALETRYEAMHGDTVRKYATVILPRMWKPEINEIVEETGVTKDLALDLIIAMPMVGTEWNGSNIDAFYGRFLDKMLSHAEDNMDVLNYEVQGMLYTKFFGKSKTALKVIGKYLTTPVKETFESDVQEAVYKDFIKMLYTKLDEYDIKDIAYVLTYVKIIRKHDTALKTIFVSTDASKFDNVKKGLMQVLDEDSEAMTYLA
jgi:hypothetical protein